MGRRKEASNTVGKFDQRSVLKGRWKQIKSQESLLLGKPFQVGALIHFLEYFLITLKKVTVKTVSLTCNSQHGSCIYQKKIALSMKLIIETQPHKT